MHDLAIGQNELHDELSDEFDNELDSEMDNELADQLLEVESEEELDQFFGKLIRGAGRLLKSPVGKMLTGALRSVAKTALPGVASALGNFVVPGLGGVIGGKLGGLVASRLELQEEFGEGEVDQEIARRLIRVARQAAQAVVRDPRVRTHAREVVRSAINAAVGSQFPNVNVVAPLAQPTQAVALRGPGGRWYRRGNRIILVGV